VAVVTESHGDQQQEYDAAGHRARAVPDRVQLVIIAYETGLVSVSG
jgi:hypothetical protein